jgi:hypothetical protein
LSEDVGAEADVGLVLSQSEAEEVVRSIFLESLKLLCVIRHAYQKLLLIHFESGILMHPYLSSFHQIIVLFVAGIFRFLHCLFLEVAVEVVKFEILFSQVGKDCAEVISEAGGHVGAIFCDVFEGFLREERAIEDLHLRVNGLDGGRLRLGVAVGEEDPLDEVIEGEAEVFLVD